MSDVSPRASRPAPVWVARLLFTFVALSLAALIVIPWNTARRLQPYQERMNLVADSGRSLVTQMHLHMAQEGAALDAYLDDHDPATLQRFRDADATKQRAYARLSPLVTQLGAEPARRLERLLALESQWHARVESNVLGATTAAAPRHDPVEEELYDSMLIAAAELDHAISQAARDARQQIAEREQSQQRTSASLSLLALGAAAATWWLSKRAHDFALQAEERRAALADAMASRARFMRGVSHDLKNPVHAIDGHAQLLEEELRGPLTSEQRDSVARIRRSASALMGLIEDLLELERAEAGQLAVKLDRVVLGDVVHETVEQHRAAAEAAGLALVRSGDGASMVLVTDAARVSQVLGNLLSNAIKYTPAGGRIDVRTEMHVRRDGQENPRLAIHVVDDGPGIPVDKREVIFDEFTRLDGVDKPGAGLGLSIARRIARLLGGDVTVSAGGERGARFTLWLPERS